jgi:hypothetical protein
MAMGFMRLARKGFLAIPKKKHQPPMAPFEIFIRAFRRPPLEQSDRRGWMGIQLGDSRSTESVRSYHCKAGDLMGIYSDLMGIYGDLMGY